MERLMTIDDVAEYLRLNREVVLRKARRGEIPAVKVGTKTYRFYKEQVDEWLKSKSTVKPELQAYPLASKKRTSNKDLPLVIKETTTSAEAKKAAASNKERQLAVLKQAAALRARIKKRVGESLPDSAREIRALREERTGRGF